jgi:hypothetical protein
MTTTTQKKPYKKMFEDIKFNDDIKNNILVKEYFNLKKSYVSLSEYKEFKVNEHLKNFLIFHASKGVFRMKKDLKTEQKNYKNLVYLKTQELERIRNSEELIPFMITLTLPTEFHPFRLINKINDDYQKIYELNENFIFSNVDTRLKCGYKKLNKIYREFYKLIKKDSNKNIKFMKIIEPHKSLVPHLHCIIFLKIENHYDILKHFNKVVKKYNLTKTEFEPLFKNVNYVIKYILKNFQEEDLRMLDGWKKRNKIRLFTMSNLDLSSEVFKKLYINNRELNNQILTDIKEHKTDYKNLYEYYTKNTNINKIYIDEKREVLPDFYDENGEILTKKDDKKFQVLRIIKKENLEKDVKENLENGIKKMKFEELKTYIKTIKNNRKLSFEILEKEEKNNKKIYLIKELKEELKTKKINVYTTYNLTIEKENEFIYEKQEFKKIYVEDYKEMRLKK